ncbi:MAG: enolase C-terminal domain-like protein [Parcubacteria group bacterium]|jgi:L-alanine-DL-glutamate epimerase-like enolase superfamily enzyme
MKIVNIEAKKVNIRLSRPFSYFLATLNHLPYVIVSIKLESGIVGYGEAAMGWDTTGEVQGGGIEIFNLIIKPILKNKRISNVPDVEKILFEVNQYVYGNTALKAGLEAALLDALGKLKNKPVYVLLGGIKKEYIIPQKVFSFEENDFQKLKEEIEESKKQGVAYFKFKAGKKIDSLIKILDRLSRINPDYSFIIDVNQGWNNSDNALKAINKLEKFNIAWIEQPVRHADFEGLAEIRRKTKIPIMADESCHNILDLENLYLRKSVDMINIKLAKCGGIIEAKKMINFCDKHKIKYMLGDMLQSSLGTAANLQAATLGNFVSYDLTMPERIKSDPFGGLVFGGLKAYIPKGYGLGVDKK